MQNSTDKDKKSIYKILIVFLVIGTLLGIIIAISKIDKESENTNISSKIENLTTGYDYFFISKKSNCLDLIKIYC